MTAYPTVTERVYKSGLFLPAIQETDAPAKKEDEKSVKKEVLTNGEKSETSPKKTPNKLPPAGPRRSDSTHSQPKSPSKSSPKTPDTPNSSDKKKLPMNKIQVGAAPSPNLKCVRSKIGSLENASHKPGGGKVKIETKKVDFSKAQPKIAAKNDTYAPGGGDKKITHVKLQWNAKPKVGSLDNATHKPGGGDKKIESVKLDFKDKAKPKVGSKENIKHVAGGGNVKIEDQKIDIKASSKIGSLENVKHKPGGGEKKIFDDKEYLKQMTALGHESLSASQGSLNKGGMSTSRSKSLERCRMTPLASPEVENRPILNRNEPMDQNSNQLTGRLEIRPSDLGKPPVGPPRSSTTPKRSPSVEGEGMRDRRSPVPTPGSSENTTTVFSNN